MSATDAITLDINKTDSIVFYLWLENDDAMGDWSPDGTYIPDIEVDCSWRAPEGGNIFKSVVF